MPIGLDQFGLAIETPFATTNAPCYRPPSWPPPRDWVCVHDANRNVVSRWGDAIWDFSPWVGKTLTINFGDGSKYFKNSPQIDRLNADILRLLITLKVWGPRGARSIQSVASNFYDEFRKIIQICSQNKIAAYDLSKYPMLIDQIAQAISPSKYDYVVFELDRLLDSRELLGFTLLSKKDIHRLKQIQIQKDTEQTEYIPPRIWAYQVTRYKECLDQYLSIQHNVEACFNFCLEAYRTNYGPSMDGRASHKSPFVGARPQRNGKRSGLVYHGAFIHTAERFGIREVLEQWGFGRIIKIKGIQALSSYLSLVTFAGLAYVANFTLMRKEEVGSIRTDCLEWHDDKTFGRIPIIRGETTKTDPDETAAWVASPSVEVALKALRSVAMLRNSCVPAELAQGNPHLFGWTSEPWSSGYSRSIEKSKGMIRPRVDAFAHYLDRFPGLLDVDQLRIREDDLQIAHAVCPTLNKSVFQIGKTWPLAWHQFRRTGAVNMFASGTISNSSIQLQMKHLSSMMPLYYGRGNANLRFTNEVRTLLVNAQYEVMGRELVSVCSDRFMSPHGIEHKALLLSSDGNLSLIHLISEQNTIRYEKAARKGEINFRRTVLGGCMRNGPCVSDGITSVSDCAGGSGKAPCSYVLFDREKAAANRNRLEELKRQLANTQPDTLKYRALEQEKRGLENYFVYTNGC